MKETEEKILISGPFGKLCCSIYGASDFKNTLLYCHGFPASRIEAEALGETASLRGITIISIDRPGLGGSEFYKDRKITDWPCCVKAVVSHFGVSRFSVMAISGGTPYGFACARFLDNMVERLLVISGVSPFTEASTLSKMNILHRSLIKVIQKAPSIGAPIAQAAAFTLGHVKGSGAIFIGCAFSSADVELSRNRKVRSILGHTLNEALSQGSKGAATDLKLLSSDWGFERSEVEVPVILVHGDDDRLVPIEMMRANAKEIPHAQTIEIPGEGHLVAFKLAPRFLDLMVAH